jgi:hypothetical protein
MIQLRRFLDNTNETNVLSSLISKKKEKFNLAKTTFLIINNRFN